MGDKSITLLHISDLQFGHNHRFGNLAVGDPEAGSDTLFERMAVALDERSDEGMVPDAIVVSGDLAEQGKPKEFKDAREFLSKLATRLAIPRSRVVMVPGNHDVNWDLSDSHFKKRQAEEKLPLPPYWPKWQFYQSMFKTFFRDERELTFTSQQPWTYWAIEELKLVVVGLNSTMAESHLKDGHYGWVGEEQLRTAVEFLAPFEESGWFRLGVVHHNPTRGATEDDENLRDADLLERILGPHLHLLLHGHTHSSKYTILGERLPVLSTGSAALRSEARPPEVPNQFQVIRLHRGGIERCALAYAPGPDQKRWIGDTRCSPDGKRWQVTHDVDFGSAYAAFGEDGLANKLITASPKGRSPDRATQAVPPAMETSTSIVGGASHDPRGGGMDSSSKGLGPVRLEILEQLARSIRHRQNVVICGDLGMGKTKMLEALREAILGDTSPNPVLVRLEAGDANPRLTIRRSLHLRFGGNFMPDEDDRHTLDELGPIVPQGAVLLVDGGDTDRAVAAVQWIADTLRDLTVVATSGLEEPDVRGFDRIELPELSEAEAQAMIAGHGLEDDVAADVLDQARNNPQKLLQRAAAAADGRTFDPERPCQSLIEAWPLDALRLVALMPSSLLSAALLVDVGGLEQKGFELLALHGTGEVVARGEPFASIHPALVDECRKWAGEMPEADRKALLEKSARHYCEWLRNDLPTEPLGAALENVMELLVDIASEPLRAELAVKLIGDDFDDPQGCIPSNGLARLLIDEPVRKKLERTATSEDVPAANASALLKNLGLFLHRANRTGGEYLLRRAIELYEGSNDVRGVASTTFILGEIAEDSGALNEAVEHFRAPREGSDDPEINALSHHLEGCAYYHWVRFGNARKCFEEAKSFSPLSPAIELRIERGLAYVDLAEDKHGETSEQRRKRIEQVQQRLVELRDRAEQLGRPREALRCTRHIGQAQLELEEFAPAAQSLKLARDGFRRLGDRRGLGATLRVLAAVVSQDPSRRPDAKAFAKESRGIALGDGLLEGEAPDPAESEPSAPRDADDDEPRLPLVRSPIGLARANEELARIELLAPAGVQIPDQRRAAAESLLRSACNIYDAIQHPCKEDVASRLASRDARFPPEIRGVVFDLVDTLAVVVNKEYERVKEEISSALDVQHDLFKEMWAKSRAKASTRNKWNAQQRIEWVAEGLDRPLEEAEARELAKKERELWEESVELDPSTVPVLEALDGEGVKMILVTNGSSAMRQLHRTLGLDPYLTSLVSCDVERLKPGPAIYRRALQELDLEAEQCLYVGDGSDRELEGAKAVGMFAVRLTAHQRERPAYRMTDSLDWDASVESLNELLERIQLAKGLGR
jgi:HAD superfamily hydrolase (TIGR01509 family)